MPDVRRRLAIRGAVQGVGFRPFAYRLARKLGVGGFVQNTGVGVVIEVEGQREQVESFQTVLRRDLPAPGFISSLETSALSPLGSREFAIRASGGGPAEALVLADQATCRACLDELFDPEDRRYLYPFINCTHCGPRYTIVESVPYDRPNTTMAAFPMCADCQAEYDNPQSRRYHAQPNACGTCGPHLSLLAANGRELAHRYTALKAAAEALRGGQVVAVKGIGGFHLLLDATDETAVMELRKRKQRPHKPFALMVPNVAWAERVCELSPEKVRCLRMPAAPIVLARRKANALVTSAVAPACPDLGILLPYAPVHHLLMALLDAPMVATSGNLTDEPLCTDGDEAIRRLGGIADLFLTHNRRIARPTDDSIVRVVAGRPMMLRRARGYAPLPVTHHVVPDRMLALGGHLKNTVALSVGGAIVAGPHVGDLDHPRARHHQRRVVRDLSALYPESPQILVCDNHPDYASTLLAEEMHKQAPKETVVRRIQHHDAHFWACLADNDRKPPALGVIWDGTGLGDDNEHWGGEFLSLDANGNRRRVAHLHRFPLPGGDAAARDGRRAAFGLLWALGQATGKDYATSELIPLSATEEKIFRITIERGMQAPWTSSAGRLFDAVASLLGVCHKSDYEGHAASHLEFAARSCSNVAAPYPIRVRAPVAADCPRIVDWTPALAVLVDDHLRGQPLPLSAARFHATLVDAIVQVARDVALPQVALSGGCFQNPTLLSGAIAALQNHGLVPLWHREIPPNDGGLAIGQLVAALHADRHRT